ncbi:hypothetical protein GGP95_000652 [Salinibacter ruber]|nr:hypothetical protein [Salinibacter ruber]MCS4150157.1 hypothetical protein [Salinibacter ruber]
MRIVGAEYGLPTDEQFFHGRQTDSWNSSQLLNKGWGRFC